MNITNLILNATICVALTWLTGNLFLGLIGAYGFHKGRMKMQKKDTKTCETETRDTT